MAANPMGKSMLGQGFGTYNPGSRGFNATGGIGNPEFQNRRPARSGDDELSQVVGALGSGIAALGAWGSTAASAVGKFAGATVEKAQSGEIMGQAREGIRSARESVAPVASRVVQSAASFWQVTAQATSQLAANAKASLVEGKDVGLFDGFDGWDDEEPDLGNGGEDALDNFHSVVPLSQGTGVAAARGQAGTGRQGSGSSGGGGGGGGWDVDGWEADSPRGRADRGARNVAPSPGASGLASMSAGAAAAHMARGSPRASPAPPKASTDGWDAWEGDGDGDGWGVSPPAASTARGGGSSTPPRDAAVIDDDDGFVGF